MAEGVNESVDLWEELEAAEQTVDGWPEWQQRFAQAQSDCGTGETDSG